MGNTPSISVISIAPYRVMFPLGFAHAVTGVTLWILFGGKLTAYPGQLHAHHMMHGFLFSFASGFILTSFPKMTGTSACTRMELLFASLISAAALLESSAIMPLSLHLHLAIFTVRRFQFRFILSQPHLLFIPVGILLGILGSLFLFLTQFQILNPKYMNIGRSLLVHGTMLPFLLGIGGKLITALLGLTSAAAQKRNFNKVRATGTLATKQKTALIICFAFLLSFALEATVSVGLGRSMRALCASWISFMDWRIYEWPKSKTKLAAWIWISSWLLLIGLWVHCLFPSLNIHAAHLIFIGGFSLTTVLVSSRVVLAHGGYPLTMELHSKIFTLIGTLILFSAVLRFVAHWASAYYFLILTYASALWLVGALIWGIAFLPKILVTFASPGSQRRSRDQNSIR